MSKNLIDPNFDPLTELRMVQHQLSEVTEAVILLQKNQNQLILANSDSLARLAKLEQRIKNYEKNNSQGNQRPS